MREYLCNLWKGDVVVITTNGFVKKDLTCVMGRGVAKQAATRYPEIPLQLGKLILEHGNHVFDLGIKADGKHLFSFPVKPVSTTFNGTNVVHNLRNQFFIGQTVPGWAAVADLEIIERSARELLWLVDNFRVPEIWLPRPGCGAGELSWELVKPVLLKYFDDRFVVVTK